MIPMAKKAETSKPDPYANYTTGELADMIANTTNELQSAISLLDNLTEESDTIQEDLARAFSSYQEEKLAHRQHQEEVAKAEIQVQELTDNLKVIAEGFIGKIGKR